MKTDAFEYGKSVLSVPVVISSQNHQTRLFITSFWDGDLILFHLGRTRSFGYFNILSLNRLAILTTGAVWIFSCLTFSAVGTRYLALKHRVFWRAFNWRKIGSRDISCYLLINCLRVFRWKKWYICVKIYWHEGFCDWRNKGHGKGERAKFQQVSWVPTGETGGKETIGETQT
jgi:hypothetical protein